MVFEAQITGLGVRSMFQPFQYVQMWSVWLIDIATATRCNHTLWFIKAQQFFVYFFNTMLCIGPIVQQSTGTPNGEYGLAYWASVTVNPSRACDVESVSDLDPIRDLAKPQSKTKALIYYCLNMLLSKRAKPTVPPNSSCLLHSGC